METISLNIEKQDREYFGLYQNTMDFIKLKQILIDNYILSIFDEAVNKVKNSGKEILTDEEIEFEIAQVRKDA
jgi:hypothetical protein